MLLGQFNDNLSKNSCIFVLQLKRLDEQLKRLDERVTETGREFLIFRTLVENCELLEIGTIQIRSLITSCSVNLES